MDNEYGRVMNINLDSVVTNIIEAKKLLGPISEYYKRLNDAVKDEQAYQEQVQLFVDEFVKLAGGDVLNAKEALTIYVKMVKGKCYTDIDTFYKQFAKAVMFRFGIIQNAAGAEMDNWPYFSGIAINKEAVDAYFKSEEEESNQNKGE